MCLRVCSLVPACRLRPRARTSRMRPCSTVTATAPGCGLAPVSRAPSPPEPCSSPRCVACTQHSVLCPCRLREAACRCGCVKALGEGKGPSRSVRRAGGGGRHSATAHEAHAAPFAINAAVVWAWWARPAPSALPAPSAVTPTRFPPSSTPPGPWPRTLARPPPPPQIPFGVELDAVQALFKPEPGYVGFRAHPHRRMVFVDFTNERMSTTAMRKFQGHVLVPTKPVRGTRALSSPRPPPSPVPAILSLPIPVPCDVVRHG